MFQVIKDWFAGIFSGGGEKLNGVIRQTLTVIAGWLIAKGVLGESASMWDIETIIGGLIGVGTTILAWGDRTKETIMDYIASATRHIIAILSGAMIFKGALTPDMLEEAVAAILAAVAAIWSIIAKIKTPQVGG